MSEALGFINPSECIEVPGRYGQGPLKMEIPYIELDDGQLFDSVRNVANYLIGPDSRHVEGGIRDGVRRARDIEEVLGNPAIGFKKSHEYRTTLHSIRKAASQLEALRLEEASLKVSETAEDLQMNRLEDFTEQADRLTESIGTMSPGLWVMITPKEMIYANMYPEGRKPVRRLARLIGVKVNQLTPDNPMPAALLRDTVHGEGLIPDDHIYGQLLINIRNR